MKDLTKIPHVKLTPEEQKEFERRAHIVDDNNNPPVIIKRIGKTTIKTSINLISLRIKPASFSVFEVFSTKTFLISLSANSSKLTLNILDNFFDCFKSGEVSPNSHFEIVCLATPTFSASSS